MLPSVHHCCRDPSAEFCDISPTPIPHFADYSPFCPSLLPRPFCFVPWCLSPTPHPHFAYYAPLWRQCYPNRLAILGVRPIQKTNRRYVSSFWLNSLLSDQTFPRRKFIRQEIIESVRDYHKGSTWKALHRSSATLSNLLWNDERGWGWQLMMPRRDISFRDYLLGIVNHV